MNRKLLLSIGLFLVTCIGVSLACNMIAIFAGLNTDTGNAQGPGQAGNTPATLLSGIVAIGVAFFVTYRFYRNRAE